MALALMLGWQVTVKAQNTPNHLISVGNKLYDSRGKEVQLTGVNWFGFETPNKAFHGLWSRDMKSVLQQIKDLGFNCIRIPWTDEMLLPGASTNSVSINASVRDPYTGNPLNTYLDGVTKPIDVLDIAVQWCQENDIKIILDNHSRLAGNFANEFVWYTSSVPEEKWIENWVFMANRYKNYSCVVGMDLDNEPHGIATWGNSSPATDWNKAAERCGNAILKANPNVLIVVEGIGENFWWGGDLSKAGKFPVQLSNPFKLMYSTHEYGPEVFEQTWFSASNFPNNMLGIRRGAYHYLNEQNAAPILLGEFGIKNQTAFGGVSLTWFKDIMKFMNTHGYSWTFWCMNPNSGDTGGILTDNWISVEQWKMDILTPYLTPRIPNTIPNPGAVNYPPAARFSATPVKGRIPLPVTLDASTSNDPNGDVLTYSWDFGDGSVGTGKVATHTYATIGTFTAKLTVKDPAGKISSVSTTIVAKDNTVPLNPCQFDAPREFPLPAVSNKNYSKVYVLGEDGPNLNNITGFSINWNGQAGTLWQLSLNTSNGVPNWYMDLRTVSTNTFTSPEPTITFKNSGFAGLDGTYYVTTNGDNFVMVSKDRNFTIYCTNATTLPSCATPGARKGIGSVADVQVTPNPSSQNFTLNLNHMTSVKEVKVFNQTGALVLHLKKAQIKDAQVTFGQDFKAGMYMVRIVDGNQTHTLKVVKQ